MAFALHDFTPLRSISSCQHARLPAYTYAGKRWRVATERSSGRATIRMAQLRGALRTASAHAVLRRFLMEIFMLILVGLVAGVGVSLMFRSGGSMLSDIVFGVAGAFVGGIVFRVTDLHTQCGELTGTIVVAFGGAVVMLGGLQLIRRVRSKV